jgi:DNA-binding FadR family transcriptional regulator
MEEQPSGLNIADTIFRELRRQILVGELSAGQRLPGERDLAIQYGTNRNTLREAVRKLEQARLVTVRHGQGVTISDFKKTGTMDLLSPMLESGGSPADLMHILEDILPARELVLEFSTRLAVRRADRSDIDRLTGITELLVTAFETKDGALVGKGFHRRGPLDGDPLDLEPVPGSLPRHPRALPGPVGAREQLSSLPSGNIGRAD